MSTTKKDYQSLLPFCKTDRQREIIILMHSAQSYSEAARTLGIKRQSVSDVVNAVKKNATSRGKLGKLKDIGVVPDGYYAETSVKRRLNPDTGEMEVVEDWTKSRKNNNFDQEAFEEFINGIASQIKPIDPTPAPALDYSDQLASAIVIGDAHIGMLTHAIENLDRDFNIEIACSELTAAIDYLVHAAPAAEEGWFINVGDFVHASSTHNTTHAGTKVDMAANHNQVMRAAAGVMRYSIDKMLTKFKKVRVINARGNHDADAAFALNMMLEVAYENEPRVEVQGNDQKFNFIEFGKCLIGINHGDKINRERLANAMYRYAAPAWGRTTFRRWYVGHIHHKEVEELTSGLTIESFHNLAPNDQWHHDSGYGSESRISMIILHKEFGEVNRMAPSLDMIRAVTVAAHTKTTEEAA